MKRRSFLTGLLSGTALVIAAPSALMANNTHADMLNEALYGTGVNLGQESSLCEFIRQHLINLPIWDKKLTNNTQGRILVVKAVDDALKDFKLPNNGFDPINIIVKAPAPVNSITFDVDFSFNP